MEIQGGIKKYLKARQAKVDKYLSMDRRILKSYNTELDRLIKKEKKSYSTECRIRDLKESKRRRSKTIRRILEDKKVTNYKDLLDRIKKLRKSTHLIGIEASACRFNVFTKPLVVRKKKIGSYIIKIPYSSNDIIIINVNKSRGDFQHWFVDEDNIPCFSQWKEGIYKSLDVGDLDVAILYLIQFLTSSYESCRGFIDFSEFSIQKDEDGDDETEYDTA